MKKIPGLTILLLVSLLSAHGQTNKTYNAVADKVLDTPVFIYSEPAEEYKIVGKAASFGEILKFSINETATLNDKANTLVKNALNKVKNEKIPAFDAILIDIRKEKIHAITFNGSKSLHANVQDIDGVLIYLFSKPAFEYEKVADLPPPTSPLENRGLLSDKIGRMTNKALRKAENGKIKNFDAIIYNPDDLSGTAIKFK